MNNFHVELQYCEIDSHGRTWMQVWDWEGWARTEQEAEEQALEEFWDVHDEDSICDLEVAQTSWLESIEE